MWPLIEILLIDEAQRVKLGPQTYACRHHHLILRKTKKPDVSCETPATAT